MRLIGLQALETGMYLIGCLYNLCVVHDELGPSKHVGSACTPAMAAKLTDRQWSVSDVFPFAFLLIQFQEDSNMLSSFVCHHINDRCTGQN